MAPAAAVRMTVRQPAARPVRRGWTTSAGGQPLVEVAAPAQHEHPAAPERDRPGLGPVPARRIGREVGQRGEGDGLVGATQELGRPREAAAQEHEHVVVLGPEATAQLPGTLRRPVGGVLHGPMVEGGPARAA